jgi:transposase
LPPSQGLMALNLRSFAGITYKPFILLAPSFLLVLFYLLLFSMSDKLDFNKLLDLPGVEITCCEQKDDCINIDLKVVLDGTNCPQCTTYTEEINQIRPIVVRDLPISEKQVYLTIPRRQFYCKLCQRYITEKLPFIDLRRKYTQRYEKNIYHQLLHSNFELVCKKENLSPQQAKSIFNHVQKLKNK